MPLSHKDDFFRPSIPPPSQHPEVGVVEVAARVVGVVSPPVPRHTLDDETVISSPPDEPSLVNEDHVPLSHPVGARLQKFWSVWERHGAEPWVVQVLKVGYQIPFHTLPPLSPYPQEYPSYLGNREKFQVLEKEVAEMLQKEAIEEVSAGTPGFYNRLFLVQKASGAWRPVLDVSRLNHFVAKTKFSMETNQSVLSAIHQGDWLISMDMKDAYFHVPIHETSRKYLRFMFNGQIFQFKALCFGLSSAPQVFTRVMAPLAKFVHLVGMRIILYLDDWLVLARTLREMRDTKAFVLNLVTELGILINWEKSQLQPRQSATYLGMEIDTVRFWASPAQKRITSTLSTVQEFLSSRELPAKSWMKLLGHMSSLEKFVTGARLRMRPLQYYLNQSWDRSHQSEKTAIRIPLPLLPDIAWWNCQDRLGRGISLAPRNPDLALLSDASRSGWGATIAGYHYAGLWSEEELALHINNLELRAIWNTLRAAEHLVVGKTVSVFADNSTALSYLLKQGGTRSWQLYSLVRQILLWAEERNVILLPQFISGTKNVTADALSRDGQILSTEWTLHHDVCSLLWKTWGQPSVDLFATSLNHRLPQYMSPHHDPQAVAIDAMLQSWSNMDLYAFPPFAMIRTVINKFQASHNCRMTLVAPWWPQREWFPDLLGLLIDTPRTLPSRLDLLSQPVGRVLHPNLPTLRLTGWRLSSDSLERSAFQARCLGQSITQGALRPTTSTSRGGQSTTGGAELTNILPLVLP